MGRKQIFDVFFKLGASKSSLNRWITCLESNEKLDRVTGLSRSIKIAKLSKNSIIEVVALKGKVAKPKCRIMAEEYKDIEFVFDDESYFTKANTNIAGNDQFYSNDVEQTPDNVKNTPNTTKKC